LIGSSKWHEDFNFLSIDEYDQVGVNSEITSFYFRFKMFKLIDGGKYRIASFSNDGKKIFNPTENRGNCYFCVEVNVHNNLAYLDLIINDGQKVIISVPNFTFKNKEFVIGVALINVKDKVFKYALRKLTQTENASEGEYNYKHIPERVQESGKITLYGVTDKDLDRNVYNIPEILVDKFGVYTSFKDYIKLFNYNENIPKTDPTCQEGCDICYWNIKNSREICLRCLEGYIEKPISENAEDGDNCEKNLYNKINLFKGNLIQSGINYPISDKSIFNGYFALYFQLIFNFAFYDYQNSYSILKLGELNIVVSKNKLYALINKDSVEIPIIDIYRKWNNIMLDVSGNTLTITVKAGAKTNTSTLISYNLYKIKGDEIIIYCFGYSTTFGAVSLSSNLDINQIKQEDPSGYDDCGPNCAYCENGKCKVCGAGNSDKNDPDCDDGKKQFISEYYDSADENGLIASKYLFTEGEHNRFIRMKKWTLQTNIEFDEILPDKNEVTFFKFLNLEGIDSIIGKINMNTGIVNFYLNPSETVQKGEKPEKVTLKLPEKIKSPYFFFAISYENYKFRAIFAETETNFATTEYTMSAFLGTFGPDASFEFHNNGIKANIGLKIFHTTFFYNYAKNLNDLENNLKKRVKKIQQDCKIGTISNCKTCNTGFIKNGFCYPPNVKIGYTALISEYEQINKFNINKSNIVQLGNLNEFTLTFTYRMVNLLSDTQNLIRIFYENNVNLFTIFYNPSKDKFYLFFGNNNYRWISNNVYSTSGENPFDFVQISVTHSIISGKGNFYVKSLNGTTILSQTISADPGSKITGNPKYTIYYGFNNGNTVSGSFELGGIEVFDYALKESEINKFIYNGLIEAKVGCKELISGSCISPLSDEETDFTSRVYDKATSNFPLFNNLLATSSVNKYYSFNKYIISFELDANYFYSNKYTANQNYLFAITDFINDNILNYAKTKSLTVIHKSLSLYLSGTTFAIKTPTLPWSNSTQQNITINFGDGSLFKENIIVSFYADAENNKLSMVLNYKSTSYFYDLELETEQLIPPIGFASLVYGHPALKNFNINFNSIDFVHNFYDSFGTNISNNCANGNGNSYCPNCSAKFRLFQSGCYITRKNSLY
jgi:hypothetical protein